MTSTQDCRFVSSLEELDLTDSALQGLHVQALSACSNLAKLYLEQAELLDTDGNQQLSANLSALHPQISCLTKLHLLHLAGETLDLTELHWLSHMTRIQNLRLEMRRCDKHALDKLHTFSALTRLDLSRYETETSSVGPASPLHVDCHWHHLSALRDLLISDCELHCTPHSATSLLQLKRLRAFSLRDVTCTQASLFTVAALLGRLDTKPQVKLCVSGESNLSQLWQQQRLVPEICSKQSM